MEGINSVLDHLEDAQLTLDEYLRLRDHCGSTTLHDDTWGPLRLGPLAAAFLNTPAVQRLRNLRQLGCAPYVFQSAEHSRYTHSVGAAHLAFRLTKHLWEAQEGLALRPMDAELLELAALLHDLGHGPFSHVFEGEILPAVLGQGHEWSHECMSSRLLQHVVDELHLDLDGDHVRRVQDLIHPGSGGRTWGDDEAWQLQVVANEANGVDVDKIDYLQRDSRHTLGRSADFTPLLASCRVAGADVCFSEAAQPMLAGLFETRAAMHAEVYQHWRVKAAEYMVVDALREANGPLGIVSGAIHDPEEFLQLTDGVLSEVRREARRQERAGQLCPALAGAAATLARLDRGDLYEFVAEAEVPAEVLQQGDYTPLSAEDVVGCQSGAFLQPGDVRVHNLKIDHCRGSEDPLQHVWLYDSCGRLRRAAEGLERPTSFLLRQVRVYLQRPCSDAEERRALRQALLAAFTCAVRKRFGHNTPVSARGDGGGAAAAAARRAGWCAARLGALRQAQPQASCSAVVLSWEQARACQQPSTLAAAAGPACGLLGDYVPATDEEEDDEDMLSSQLSTQDAARLPASSQLGEAADEMVCS